MSAVTAPLQGLLRIGAFSRRVGVSASVLRAWETRYGLFTPARTPGGFRLYSPGGRAPRAADARAARARPGGARSRRALVLAERRADDGRRSALVDGVGARSTPTRAHARSTRCSAGRSRAAVVAARAPGARRAADEWARRRSGRRATSRSRHARDAAARARRALARGARAARARRLRPGRADTLGAIAFALALHAAAGGSPTSAPTRRSRASSPPRGRCAASSSWSRSRCRGRSPRAGTELAGSPHGSRWRSPARRWPSEAAARRRARRALAGDPAARPRAVALVRRGSWRTSTSSRPMSCRRARMPCRPSWSAPGRAAPSPRARPRPPGRAHRRDGRRPGPVRGSRS